MRTIAALVILGSVLTTIGDPADAARRRVSDARPASNYSNGERQRERRVEQSADRARADNADPSRQYGGYPDWARYAFSGKGNRGGR